MIWYLKWKNMIENVYKIHDALPQVEEYDRECI